MRRQRHDTKAARAQRVERRRPRLDPRERHAQRRRHRRADRLSVQRIGARAIEQHAVDAERQRDAEQAADVVGIADAFDRKQARAAREGPERERRSGPARERQAAAMKVDSR